MCLARRLAICVHEHDETGLPAEGAILQSEHEVKVNAG